MITNETRARLIGWTVWEDYHRNQWWTPPNESKNLGSAPSYDTDANAVAELRAFVRARGKIKRFQLELWNVVLGCVPLFEPSYEQEFNLIDATPQQLCAAFDATFKDELEKIQ